MAEKVVRDTSRRLHFGIMNNVVLREIKRGILPILSRVKAVKQKLAYDLSEIGIAYSRSPLIQKDSAAFRHQHDLAPGSRARPVEVTKNGSPLSLWSELLHPGHTLLVFLGSLTLQDAVEAIEVVLTEAGGALRTLFIQRTPDRNEMKGVEILQPAGRAHSRYGTRAASWYLIRPDQYVAARGALEDIDSLRSYIRQTLVRHDVEATIRTA